MKRSVRIAAFAVALTACGSAVGAETLAGHPVVLDGDTLRLQGTVVGLFGIAAPGPDQICESAAGVHRPCGREAVRALADRIAEGEIACEARGLDRNRRPVFLCRLGGEDLAAWMVERGHAVPDRVGAPDYVAQETKAWATRRGLWAGVFQDPAGRSRPAYPAAPQMAALAK